ncbi:hypothetical protein JTB14_003561 [Gonioctena quinquepunctata]|nr:hypothetical protein JTB14_003561 [Gonioctena quinquepunctata]
MSYHKTPIRSTSPEKVHICEIRDLNENDDDIDLPLTDEKLQIIVTELIGNLGSSHQYGRVVGYKWSLVYSDRLLKIRSHGSKFEYQYHYFRNI